MKYMLMFIRNDEEFLGDPELEAQYGLIGEWFGRLGADGKLLGGEELEPASSATTVHFDAGRPVVTDGPFMEAKEHIAGYAVVDVADLDEAIAVASDWPAKGHRLEIRPVVGHHDH